MSSAKIDSEEYVFDKQIFRDNKSGGQRFRFSNQQELFNIEEKKSSDHRKSLKSQNSASSRISQLSDHMKMFLVSSLTQKLKLRKCSSKIKSSGHGGESSISSNRYP